MSCSAGSGEPDNELTHSAGLAVYCCACGRGAGYSAIHEGTAVRTEDEAPIAAKGMTVSAAALTVAFVTLAILIMWLLLITYNPL